MEFKQSTINLVKQFLLLPGVHNTCLLCIPAFINIENIYTILQCYKEQQDYYITCTL